MRTDSELAFSDITIPSVIDQTGFRIVQESLTNVVRHSHASNAQVRIVGTPDMLRIEVIDNGRGSPVDHVHGERGHGHGLQGMAERATAVGGSVSAGPGPNRGWRVSAELPLRAGAM